MAQTLRLADTRELDIKKTFECGQCFRWAKNTDGAYSGVAFGYPALVWAEGESVFVRSDAPEELWREYFDLATDYAAVSQPFLTEGYLKTCTEYGAGIRILRQEPWEALCSFIISQCNNITRISGIVDRLCRLFGERVELDGGEYYTFPTAERIAALTPDDLAPLRCGYRAPYILTAARAIADGTLDIGVLGKMDCVAAKKELMKLNGIGEKVANCVVLFGLGHMEAFPIDVWIRRALKEHFSPDFDPASLGEYAGLAQQYIFYYARSTGE